MLADWETQILSSDFVLKSTLKHLVKCVYVVPQPVLIENDLFSSALFMRVLENVAHFSDVITECVASGLEKGSFNDPRAVTSTKIPAFQVLLCTSIVLYEYV